MPGSKPGGIFPKARSPERYLLVVWQPSLLKGSTSRKKSTKTSKLQVVIDTGISKGRALDFLWRTVRTQICVTCSRIQVTTPQSSISDLNNLSGLIINYYICYFFITPLSLSKLSWDLCLVDGRMLDSAIRSYSHVDLYPISQFYALILSKSSVLVHKLF